jgi:mycothiol synthase
VTPWWDERVQARKGQLPKSTVAQIRVLAQAATDSDLVAPLGEQTLLDLVGPDPPVLHLLVGDPVEGYAALDLRGRPTAEIVVSPAVRRRGLGRALLSAVRQAAVADAGTDATVWAHGDLPAARALATSAGLTARRELWQMTRALAEPATLPAVPPLPPDVVVRPFTPGHDDDAMLTVNARAFANHPEQGRITADDLAARMREPWFRAEDLLLAERDDRPVAFVWTKLLPADDAGELYVLGVDPAAQGTGLGGLLTTLALHHLAGRGARSALLYTDADNAAAVRLYTAAGFTRSRADVQYG